MRPRVSDPALLFTVPFAVLLVVALLIFDRPCTEITLVSSNEKSDLLRDIAADWNRSAVVDWRCAKVQVVVKPSGSAEAALARGWNAATDGSAPPDVWSPAASSWNLLLRQHLEDRGVDDMVPPVPPSIMQSPLVFAMPEPLAQILVGVGDHPTWVTILGLAADPAGWSRYQRPDLGRFKLAKTDPMVSTSGLHVLIGTYVAATGRVPTEEDVAKPVVREYVRSIELAVAHRVETVASFLRDLKDADTRGEALTYVSAIAMEEKQVWDYNRGVIVGDPRPDPEPRVPNVRLAPIYPRPATLVADHPYVVLNATWATDEKRRVADAFLRHLLSQSVQDRFARAAFRDHLGHAGRVITNAPGLSAAASSATMGLPTPRALERIQSSWDALRR